MTGPLCFSLDLSGSATLAELRGIAGAVVDAFTGESGGGEGWRDEVRQAADPDGGAAAHRATWVRPGARLSEEVAAVQGNPRSGFVYALAWRLEIAEPRVVMDLQGAGHARRHAPLRWEVRVPTPGDFDAVRRAVVAVVGPRRDRTGRGAVAAHNVTVARSVDPDRARRWLAEAMDRGPRAAQGAWPALLTLHEDLHGTDARSLPRRLRTVPQDIDAWERAATEGVRGFSAARVAAVLARLRPYDPAVIDPTAADWSRAPAPTLGWLRLDVGGAGPVGAAAVLELPGVVEQLWSRVLRVPLRVFDRHAKPGGDRVLWTSLHAAWIGRGGLPQVVVERWSTAIELPPPGVFGCPGAITYRHHTWCFGPGADDCLQLVACGRQRGAVVADVELALGASGSPAFIARIQAATEPLAVRPGPSRPGP